MKGFIQGTLFTDSSKVAIAVDKIVIVVEDTKYGTYIQTGRDKKGNVRGLSVKESYAEVIVKIAEAQK